MKKTLALIVLLFAALPAGAWWQSVSQVSVSGGGAVTTCGVSSWGAAGISGLTHCWPMNDATVSGTTINDPAGSLNGTAGSGVSSTTGPVTQARLMADTANGYITLASTPIADVSSNWSIGYWINTQGTPNGCNITFDLGDPRIFNFFDGTSQMANACSSISSKIGLDSNSGVAGQGLLDTAIVLNTWTHIVITHASGSSTQVFYLNGSSATAAGALGDAMASVNTLGARAVGERPCKCALYQFVIYNKVLSAGEVSTLFAAQ